MNNPQQQQTVQGSTYSFWGRNWPRFFILCSLAVVVLTFVALIFNLINMIVKPNVLILTIYCMLFSLLAFSAEVRQFTFTRKIVYVWMKYFYFLTYYKPRGLFYIFLGLLLLGDSVLLYAAAGVSIGVGVVMLVTSFVVDLAVYDDPQETAREQREHQRYFESAAGAGAGAAVAHMFHNKHDKKDKKQQQERSETFRAAAEASESAAATREVELQMKVSVPPPVAKTQRASASPAATAGAEEGSPSTPDVAAGKQNSNNNNLSRSDSDAFRPRFGSRDEDNEEQAKDNNNNHFNTPPNRSGNASGMGVSQLRRDFAAAMEDA